MKVPNVPLIPEEIERLVRLYCKMEVRIEMLTDFVIAMMVSTKQLESIDMAVVLLGYWCDNTYEQQKLELEDLLKRIPGAEDNTPKYNLILKESIETVKEQFLSKIEGAINAIKKGEKNDKKQDNPKS